MPHLTRRDLDGEDPRPRQQPRRNHRTAVRPVLGNRRRSRPSGCPAPENAKNASSNKESACPFVEKVAQIEDGAEVGGAMALGPEGEHLRPRQGQERRRRRPPGRRCDGAEPDAAGDRLDRGRQLGQRDERMRGQRERPRQPRPGARRRLRRTRVHVRARQPGRRQRRRTRAEGPRTRRGGKPGNCPQGAATPPAAEAGGFKLSSFPIADNVSLSSELTQANALSTEWEFGDETKQTVETRQQQKTLVQHQFKKEGTLTVTENIHSDDLATPTITVSEKVTIVAPQGAGRTGDADPPRRPRSKREVNPMKSPTKCEFQVAPAADTKFTERGSQKARVPDEPRRRQPHPSSRPPLPPALAGSRYRFRLLAKAGAWESSQEGTEFEIGRRRRAGRDDDAPRREVAATHRDAERDREPEGQGNESLHVRIRDRRCRRAKRCPARPRPEKAKRRSPSLRKSPASPAAPPTNSS